MTVATMEDTPELSLIMLCYREEEQIPSRVASVEAELAALGVTYEIVVVANYFPGRGDRSPEIARRLAENNPRVRIVAEPKQGMMGWDMVSGLEAARGRILAVIDGDGQIDPRDVPRVYRELRVRQLDVCQANRIRREDGWRRVLVSRIYNALFQLLFPGTGLHDINAKPKLVTREAYRSMRLSSTDWFTDADIIIEARRLALRCGEIPTVFGKGARPSFIGAAAVREFIKNLVLFRLRESLGGGPRSAERIRVLHLVENLGRGGAERRLACDLRWLDRERYEHRVVYLTEDAALRPEIEALGIPVEGLGLRSPRQWALAVLRLSRRLRAWRPHIVHTQVFAADVYGRLCAAITGVPIVLSTIQTMPYVQSLGPFYSRKRKLADRWTARLRTDRFIAVSEAVKRAVVESFGAAPSRVVVIPNGVDLTRFGPRSAERLRARESLGIAPDAPCILHVGRLIPEKNQAALIRAVAALKARLPGIRLAIAGDGPCRIELEQLISALGVGSQVLLLGTRSDIEQLHHAADCFVLPSLREGLPLSLVEAMASQLPVIASSIAPHMELIEPGRTGWLVEPHDTARLAETIARVVERPDEAARIAEAGRKEAERRFSAEASAGALQALYDALCRERGWTGPETAALDAAEAVR